MTNDELNAFYHFLTYCQHRREVIIGKVPECKECDKPYAPDVPDYLSDSDVMWDIVKELLNAGWDMTYTKADGAILDPPDCVAPIEDVIMDESLERAVMLALKAKEEG